jgi:hypothetical protein
MSLVKRPYLTIAVIVSLVILITLYFTQKHQLTAAYASRMNPAPDASAPAPDASAQQQVPGRNSKPVLGIEVSQTRPFFMQAAKRPQKLGSAIIRVSSTEGKGSPHESASAIRLEPIVEKDKVRVNVFVLYGDTQSLTRCEDVDALRTVKAGSYVRGLNQEVQLTILRKYGIKMEKDPFTFRVVSRSIFVPDVEPMGGTDCPCLMCESATCCPNPGYCSQCECVTVCCRK